MEVLLLEAVGLPAGCLLSVRAGAARRQAPAVPDKLRFSFPVVPKSKEAVKVDLLMPIGGTVLDFMGAGVTDISLPGLDGEKDGMRMSLKVQEVQNGSMDMNSAEDKKGAARGDGTARRRHREALSARNYLDQHGLLTWLQVLFQDLIRDQPADPWSYVEGKTAMARQSAGGHVSSWSRPGSAQWKEAGSKAPVEPSEVEVLRKQAGVGLAEADADGRLAAVVSQQASGKEKVPPQGLCDATMRMSPGEPAGENLETIRNMAKVSLLKACSDGRFPNSLQKVIGSNEEPSGPPEVPSGPPEAPQKTFGDDGLPSSMQKEARLEPSDVDELAMQRKTSGVGSIDLLRDWAREALGSAAVDGRLTTTLEEVSKDRMVAEEGEEPRLQTLALLSRASKDGRLAAALQKGKAPMKISVSKDSLDWRSPKSTPYADVRADELRMRARSALTRAGLDRTLSSPSGKRVPQVVASSDEAPVVRRRSHSEGELNPEELRAAARSALWDASLDGRLTIALKNAKGRSESDADRIEQIRERARQALTQVASPSRGSTGGRELRFGSEGLLRPSAEDSDVEALRRRARSALSEASLDGRLTEALRELELDVNALQRKAEISLSESVLDQRRVSTNSLDLSASAGEESAEDLRNFARDALTRACIDGKLEAAMEDALGSRAQFKTIEREDSPGDLRNLARDALTRACLNGKLDAAMEEALGSRTQFKSTIEHEDSTEDLRNFARDALTRACLNGKLDVAMEQALASRTQFKSTMEAEDSDVQEVRKTRSVLYKAEMETRSSSIVQSAKQQAKPKLGEDAAEALRMFARETLTRACVEGTLDTAIEEARKPSPGVEQVPAVLEAQDTEATLLEAAYQVRQSLSELRLHAERQITDLREQVNEARRDLFDFHTEVKGEFFELGETAREAKREVNELRDRTLARGSS